MELTTNELNVLVTKLTVEKFKVENQLAAISKAYNELHSKYKELEEKPKKKTKAKEES